MKTNCIVMIGSPCTGKTTWCENFLNNVSNRKDWIILSYDIIRENFFKEYEINEINESIVNEIFFASIKACVEKKHIIIDNMNIDKFQLTKLFKSIGLSYNIKFKVMPLLSLEEIYQRQDSRISRYISREILKSKHQKFKDFLQSDYFDELIINKKIKENESY